MGYQQKTFLYTCQFCTDYKRIKCKKHVYYGQKGILCSGCDLWIYNKCAGLNNSTYELIQNNPNDLWYCRPCKYVMFPFLDSQKLIKPTPSLNKQVAKYIICSVCYKNNSLNRGLNCSSYDSPDHKKCRKLKQCDFLFNKITQNIYWECIACKNEKFTSANISNHEIQYLAFKSNFNCKYQTMVSDLLGDHLTHDFFNFNMSEIWPAKFLKTDVTKKIISRELKHISPSYKKH